MKDKIPVTKSKLSKKKVKTKPVPPISTSFEVANDDSLENSRSVFDDEIDLDPLATQITQITKPAGSSHREASKPAAASSHQEASQPAASQSGLQYSSSNPNSSYTSQSQSSSTLSSEDVLEQDREVQAVRQDDNPPQSPSPPSPIRGEKEKNPSISPLRREGSGRHDDINPLHVSKFESHTVRFQVK